jgi:hypothetical protein
MFVSFHQTSDICSARAVVISVPDRFQGFRTRGFGALRSFVYCYRMYMKKTLIALLFFGMAAQLVASSDNPRPLRATIVSLGNVIAVALASEDNHRVGSVIILQSTQKADAEFLYGRIALREECLVLWPENRMDEPFVLTLAGSTRFEEELSDGARQKATIHAGTKLYRVDQYWPGTFAETIALMKAGQLNKDLGIQ